MTSAIPRVIPCLLIADGRLVKTRQFASPVYVGDPVNVISIFNAFEVDEILLLDIRASVERREPPFDLLERVANEAMIPLGYGGGVADIEQMRRILWTGFEKVVVNTAASARPEFLREASAEFGSQAVVAAIDAKRNGASNATHWTHSAQLPTNVDVTDQARLAEEHGAGEILLMDVDRDGTRTGFDVDLVRSVTGAVTVPVIACGGAGRRTDLADPVVRGRAAAVAAGSLFVFQQAETSVLINFPSRRQLARIFSNPEEIRD
jgi:imidazole glycerol-phosphate synthase subunit HisF